jgi:O-antigen/teichoic acid export membrane protein
LNNSNLISRLKSTASINLVRHLCQLLIGISVARLLSVDDKGLHFVFTTFAAAGGILLSFGMANSIVYHVKRELISIKTFYRLTFLTIVMISVICVVAAFFLYPIFSDIFFRGKDHQSYFFSVFILLVVISFNNYLLSSLSLALSLKGLYFFQMVIGSLIFLALLLIGLTFLKFDIYDVIYGFVAIEGIVGVICLCFVGFKLRDCRKNVGGSTKPVEVLKYAGSCYLGVSGSTIAANGDSLIASSMLDSYQMGLYSIAKTFYRLIAIIPQTINSVAFGYFCEKEFNDSVLIVKKICLIFTSLSSIMVICSYFVLEDAIKILYGEKFIGAFMPALILVFSAALMGCTSAIKPFFLAYNRPFTASLVVVISNSIGLILCSYLILYYGLAGAALSSLIVAVLATILRLYFFTRFKSE